MPTRKPTTQLRPTTSPHPSRRLVQKWFVVAAGSSSANACSTTRGRNGSSSTSDTANVNASKTSAPPGPPAKAISTPAIAGPITLPSENVKPRRAFAGCTLTGLTVVGRSPLNAGAKKASAAPNTAASTTRWTVSAESVRSRVAASAWVTRRTASEAIRIRLRSSRSAQTPAGTASSTNGRNCAVETRATSLTPPPMERTANGSAIWGTLSPRMESTWLPKSSRYCGSSRSTAGIRTRLVSTGQGWQRGRGGATRLMVSPGTCLHDENPHVREAIVSGLVTGLAIAMPVGAVAALIVALTVRTSFRVGLGAALGVGTVDGAYAAAAVVGGGLVAQVLAPIAQPLRIGSTVVLLAIALWLVVSALRPRPERVAGNGWVTTPLRAWMAFVAITAVNPATVIYFAAIVLANRALV